MSELEQEKLDLIEQEMVPLADYAEINPHRSLIKLVSDTEVSFIPMGDTTESGRWINRQTRRYSEVRQGFTFFEEGDILFAKITPCMENGKGCIAVGLLNSVGFGSTEFHVIRARENADKGFIYQWTINQELRRKAKNFMTGSAGQQRVPKEFFSSFLIAKISKNEQTKIAEILSTVDRAIEQTEALIAKQQRIKAGLMQDLLTRGIDEHGNLRSEQTHKFKDSPLGRIPKEWEVQTLNSRALVKGGKRLPAGHAYAEGDTGYRYLQTTDFISKRLNYHSLHYLYPQTFKVLERYEITSGDVFISIAGVNLGVAGVFRPDFNDRTILTENAAMINILANDLPEYLVIQINGPMIQKQILEEKGIGAGVPKLALFRIKKFLLPWPNKKEQQQIVQIIQSFDDSMQEQKEELRKLSFLKTALMQDLLKGKKRVAILLNDTEVMRI